MLTILRRIGPTFGGAVIFAFLCGLLGGWLLSSKNDTANPYYLPRREENGEFKFIKPLLFVDVGEELAFPKFSNLKSAIAKYVDVNESREEIYNVSVYFRNLNSSQWVAVNLEESFAPASMLKVIMLMTVLRAAVEDPSLLKKEVRLEKSEGGIPTEYTIYPPAEPARVGQGYTVETLLKKLIVESDNGAYYTLLRLMGSRRVNDTYDDLKLKRLADVDSAGYTARDYSRIFRSLYNGTYLPHYLSEQALYLLSTTKFTEGMVAGLPEGTVVAHKFGIRGVASSDEARAEGRYLYYELHDCGIVYYPEEPYFLCVMTRGDTLDALESTIQEVSALVWSEIEKIY